MRKIYKLAGISCLGLVLSLTNINAQTVSDFENLTLTSNSFWDGSDMSGTHNNALFSSTFTSADAIFENVFDTTWGFPGYWLSGFSYSNMTDSTTTTGPGNKYSSRAGSGYGNSTNYIVSNNNTTIVLTGTAANNIVSGFFVTNGTYTANSMRDGDSFAKKFGGTSGNDADWFLLTIKGFTGGNLTSDSVNSYLADYRFPNNTQDYIVKDWQWVDLTSLGAIDSVYFELSSSDVGSFGMNTPSFFCIDNFNDQNVGINNLTHTTKDFTLYPNPTINIINIKLEQTINTLTIIDISGKTVLTQFNLSEGTHQLNVSELTNGLYFIKADDTVHRFIKQ